ncbi:MAG: hypothetical protein JOY56_02665 [Solirubrobacterales bacterium]|nr:hypothetical protein [Solirubrobacterales bacterium]
MISRAGEAGEAGAAALVLAAVAALILAGCGGASESAGRLRAQATRVCALALQEGARIKPPAVPAATPAFLRRGNAVLRSEIAQLRTLRPPSEQAGVYSAAVAALRREAAILGATIRDLDRGADPLPTIKALQHRLAPVETDGDAAWRTLDVPACVSR